VPSRSSLAGELRACCAAAEPEGEERVLDVLRDFREQHVFNVALGEVRGTLPLMNASDYLTFLAEAVLENALEIAWRENSQRQVGYDWPQPFVIVGYGKLGGIELGPGSDLDIVLLHDFAGDSGAFLHRLARRLLHVLTVPTYAGKLYDVDMRLRPSGNAGTMVSSIGAFTAYQREGAVVGDAALCQRFEAVRREILCLPRDRERLRQEVAAMRERMRQQGGSAPSRAGSAESSDLKRATGGMIDIEFIVQYLVLAHAHEAPELAVWSDNVRILATAGRLGILAPAIAEELTDAYLALRAEWHRGVLDLPDSSRAARVLDDHRTVVEATWRAVFDVS
jgi:glutamate-ammonia-ligase adenylyltransferase